MYSYEQRKRRGLLAIVKLLCFFIVIVIVFSLTRKEHEGPSISCKLVADKEAVKGVYTEPITVSIEVTSKNDVVLKNVGIYQNARRNKDKYVLSSNGIITLVGYVEDEEGVSTTCINTFELNLTSPSCELKVESGTLGINDWYTSDVVVTFDKMNSNQRNVNIEKYYITKSIKDIDTEKELSVYENNNSSLEIKDNGNFEIIGRVEDKKGNTGECKLNVSVDKEVPECELTIINRETKLNGNTTIPVVVGFKDYHDNVSDIYSKGVGMKKSYKEDTYSVSTYGTNKVYGYVKDNAGNENTCELEVVTINNGKEKEVKPNDVITINRDIRNTIREFFEK